MKHIEPSCQFGYTDIDIHKMLVERYEEFQKWMGGQTVMLCDGRIFNHETQEYKASGCEIPHGMITYTWDVQRFLENRPIID